MRIRREHLNRAWLQRQSQHQLSQPLPKYKQQFRFDQVAHDVRHGRNIWSVRGKGQARVGLPRRQVCSQAALPDAIRWVVERSTVKV